MDVQHPQGRTSDPLLGAAAVSTTLIALKLDGNISPYTALCALLTNNRWTILQRRNGHWYADHRHTATTIRHTHSSAKNSVLCDTLTLWRRDTYKTQVRYSHQTYFLQITQGPSTISYYVSQLNVGLAIRVLLRDIPVPEVCLISHILHAPCMYVSPGLLRPKSFVD